MHRRGGIFQVFSVFLAAALLIFVFSQRGLLKGVTGIAESLLIPVKKVMYQSVAGLGKVNSAVNAKIREENAVLASALVKEKALERENQAFRDQFAVSVPAPSKLLPAAVVGQTTDGLIIDKGNSDGVRAGSAVVYKDTVVGKVTSVSVHLATVMLPSNNNFSITAQTAATSALGILQGQGSGEMTLANVVLSDTLKQGDFVVTKDDLDKNGNGFPPNLVIGKIVSVSKRASNLFQEGKVESIIDFSKLDIVFVIR